MGGQLSGFVPSDVILMERHGEWVNARVHHESLPSDSAGAYRAGIAPESVTERPSSRICHPRLQELNGVPFIDASNIGGETAECPDVAQHIGFATWNDLNYCWVKTNFATASQ